MSHDPKDLPPTILPQGGSLFGRVASILEQARKNVVRSVNTNMVLAYWLIGREIVQELQGGEDRAEYGKQKNEQKLSLAGRELTASPLAQPPQQSDVWGWHHVPCSEADGV